MELTLRGETEGMSLDWLPPIGVSTAIAAGSGVVGWLIAGARKETKTAADLKRAEELRLADLQRAAELRSADEKRAEELRAEFREMKRAWEEGIDRVGVLASNMSNLQTSQNQINIYTTKAVDGLAEDMERVKSTLADHTSSIRLLIDKVMAK